MTRREPMRSGAEHDAFTKWRRLFCYLQRPGVAKGIKRQYNRRVRRKTRAEAKQEVRK